MSDPLELKTCADELEIDNFEIECSGPPNERLDDDKSSRRSSKDLGLEIFPEDFKKQPLDDSFAQPFDSAADLDNSDAEGLRQASCGWLDRCYCWPSEEYWDLHPRRLVICSTLIYLVPVSVGVLVTQALDAFAAQKSHFLLATYTAIRDTASAFTLFFTFFWFVEQAAVGKLKGERNWQSIGGHITLSSVTSIVCGLLSMVALFLLAEPLLRVISPEEEREDIVNVAISSQKLISLTLPANIYSLAAVGCLLGMNEVAKTAIIGVIWSAVGTVGGVMLLSKLDCETERLAFCNEEDAAETADCELTYEKDGWVCSQYGPFMRTFTIFLIFVTYGTALSLAGLQAWLVRQFRIPLFQVLDSKEFRAMWTRDTLYVALRGLLNNSRHFITLVIALRMGITQGAVWVMFVTVSQLSYSVPNVLSVVAMINVSRLIGAGKADIAGKMLNDYRIFGLTCGLVFSVLVAVLGPAIADQFASDVEQEEFNEMLKPVWKWIVMFQPIFALIGVYGPLIVATQHYVYWGQATTVCFLAVYVPFTATAKHLQSIELLVVSYLAYEICVLCALYWVVHQITWASVFHTLLVGVGLRSRSHPRSPTGLSMESSMSHIVGTIAEKEAKEKELKPCC